MTMFRSEAISPLGSRTLRFIGVITKTTENWVGEEKLPHRGISLLSLESVIQHILAIFYLGQHPAEKPLNRKTPTLTERNLEIKEKHASGVSVADLAKEYGISVSRIHQILQGKTR